VSLSPNLIQLKINHTNLYRDFKEEPKKDEKKQVYPFMMCVCVCVCVCVCLHVCVCVCVCVCV
jgi:hypothetical protein